MADYDESLIKEFISESKEHIKVTEAALLKLEDNYSNPDFELINQVFRAVHSTKGAAGFFGFKNLGDLSHKMETLLQKIRDKKLNFEEYMFEPLFDGVDYLKQMLDDIEHSEELDLKYLMNIFDKLSAGESLSGQNSEGEPVRIQNIAGESVRVQIEPLQNENMSELTINQDWIEDILSKSENNTFFIKLNLNNIIKEFIEVKPYFDNLKALGNILDISPNYNRILKSQELESIEIIYDTIMEENLISIALNIPDTDIFVFDDEIEGKVRVQNTVRDQNIEPIQKGKKEVRDQNIESIQKEKKGMEKTQNIEPIQKPTKKPTNLKIDKEDTIRVSLSHLNKLMDLAGELVLSRNQLIQIQGGKDIPVLNVLSQRITEMQENIMSTRMQPIDNLFSKFTRIVRDLSKNINKKINLVIDSKGVEVDNTIIEAMGDPLTHLIRNSVDHGIEMPMARLESGKAEVGTVNLSAEHKGGHVIITVRDDGNGIDYKKIGKIAVSKGLVSEEELSKMEEKNIIKLILRPGFSTAEKVTSISGRGVGMDVVKTNLDKIGGTIEITTKVGLGTEFLITIPLTLAIIPTLIAKVSNYRFAIPQINIIELVRLKAEEINERVEILGNSQVLRLREKLLPLVDLKTILKLESFYKDPETGEIKGDRRLNPTLDRRLKKIGEEEDSETIARNLINRKGPSTTRLSDDNYKNIIVVSMGINEFGIIIDEILDTEEIVVKPLNKKLKKINLFSGATIMGDGKVILILDISNIAREANLSFKETKKINALEQERKVAEDMMEKQDFFVFNIGGKEQFSIPLSLIERIEKFDLNEVQSIGNKEYINYLGESLRLIKIEEYLNISYPEESITTTKHLIIPQMSKVKVGIIFEKIVDVTSLNAKIDEKTIQGNGIMGTAMIDKKITLFLDIFEIVEIAEPELFKDINNTIVDDDDEKTKKILLVEDTPFFRNLVSGYIKSAGYECVTKNDGQEAFEYLTSNHHEIDLIVSDIQMPRMDGFELVAKIKADPILSHFKVLALTSLDSPENIQKGLDVGFDAYQIKVDKEKLLDSIDKMISRR
jgi:two-component system chemotaxis sensor kinase CheA